MTITTSKATVAALSQSLTARGLFSKTIELEGLYHTLALTEALEKLLALSASDKSLQFGNAPLVPLRSNVDGQIIGQSSLQRTALGILLTEVSRWDTTLLNALTDMTDHGQKTVLTLGPMDSIPALTLRELGADIIIASGSKTLVTDCLQSDSTTPGLNAPGVVEAPEYQYPVHAVAIVGMGCRFPGADSVEEFWELLSAGTSMVRNIPSERFPTKGLRRTPRLGPEKFWGNFLNNPDTFDHKFFKKSSREAQQMDPQQRLLLEVAYEALLSSGYFGENPNDSQADTGIYLGIGATDYDDNVGSHPPNAFSAVGTLRAFLSGKLSHYFGWTGPSITYDTACSSSAVALHSACRAIASGECSRALAGGANVITSPKLHQNLAAASFLSPTGATKAFDAKADGYCRGEGVGLVVLKRLSDAIAEGDNVLGVIAGSAVNQNSNESAITVPHSPSQVKLYKKAAALAGIDTRDISYAEAHGTGTPVGDPIEYESIKNAFGGPQRDSTLYLGSVKANVGHCEAASGIVALIKVILMLQHGQIPVQANFSTLNPKIKSCESDLIEIPRKTQPWETNFRAACINNYGAAGSNGTLVVCQAPTVSKPRTAAVAPRYPIFISAHSEPSLESYCSLLSDVAAESDLADVAFNLADKESRFLPQILVTTAATAGELQGKLSAKKVQSPVSKAKPLILTFSGQTSNVVGLSKGVYNGSTIFQRHLDQCDSVLRSFGLPGLYPGIFSTQPIDDLVSLHTKLFAFQYANAMSWIDCGLHVDAVMGHSFGQLTALCVSGSLSLVDVIKLLAGRAALMQTFWGPERGAMIHVDAEVATVNKIIASTNALGPPHHVSVACFNGPSSQVLVGRESSINKIEHTLIDPLQFAGRIKFQRLTTTHGFHSEFTEPILGRLSELAEQLEFNSPSIPLETCTEGQSWSKIEPRRISEHTRQPVYFEEAVRRLSDRYGPCTWLGVGPSSAIIKMVERAQGKSTSSSHSLLPVRLDGPDSLGVLADVTVNLWTLGHRVQYWPFHRCQKASYTPVTLPPYQFEKSRHWLEYVDTTSSKVPETAPTHGAAEPVTLISLAHGQSKTAREAVFKIDQRSEEFRIITTGHAVVGNPLCPMSLYVELASRAALIMRPNSDQVANVENLEIRSPLGMSTERSITLTLRQAAGDVAVWTFNLESKRITPDVKAATITSHASGKIGLHAPTHQSLFNDFSRFERLVDHRLYKDLTTDSSAESMQGAVIYKMFDLVVHYADYYHGIRSISSKDNRVAGRVSMPRNQKALDETTTHPLAVDNFLQVAGLQVNILSDCGPNEVFVATQVDQIQPGPLFNSKGDVAQSWDVFSSFSRSGGKEVINDIFVFDPVDKRLLMFILGAHFTKVSTLSLVKVLATINSNQPTSAPRVATSAAPLRPKAKREKIKAPVPAPVESTKHLKSVPLANAILQVLNKVADVPIEEESKNATFEDLGIDSLMINEVLSELRDFFAVDIPMAEFQSLQNCMSLCAYLEGKGACSPDSVFSDTSPIDSPLESSNASSVDPDDFADEMETKDSEASDVSGKLAHVIAEHLELPTESLTNGSNLADEGLDSLLGLEIISDIAEKLQVTITAADLTPETTFGALAAVLVERRGGSRSPAAKKELRTVAPAPSTAANSGTTPISRPINPDATPSVENAAQTFLDNSKYAYDPFARQLGFADFWTKVYPTETRLVVRYVVDAFEYLGCPITSLVAGQEVSVKRSLAKWWLERDMGQLYNILSESGIVVKVGDRFVRTSTTIESTSASKLLSEILEKFPQHVVEHELLDITGSQLGPCLCGDNDPLKLLFGNKATRDLLTDFYTNAPLFLAGTMVLAEFLSSVYKAKKGPGPVRILELGAGTGGTTKYIVKHLLKEGIEFEYTFTDLSSSLVATARKKFKSWGFMNFKVLDIEKTPADQFLGIYHTVLSTNCIHATKNLTNSLSNIRKTLRPDGFVSLVELTRNIPWYDLVFGLVEGWWLFNDGRTHALSGPENWERNMKAAGFTSANWTEGSPEAETLRVVAGFQGEVPAVAGNEMELKPVSTSKKPVVETVTYKESDGLELKADVYYPAELSVSGGSRPIGASSSSLSLVPDNLTQS